MAKERVAMRRLISFIRRFSIIGAVVCGAAVAYANDTLIGELESLRKTLSPKDKSRSALTRRLADLYFDESIRMDKDNILKGVIVPTPKLKKYRLQGITLYREALNGARGQYEPASGQLKIKIQFQLARLYFVSGKKKKAAFYYKAVLANKRASDNLVRESALQMAEYSESLNNFNDSGRYYKLALKLCAGDVCSYAHYRLAWLFYRAGVYPEAVVEGRKALWDSKGNIREQALIDFIVFLSNIPGGGEEQFEEMDRLAKKLKRPQLVRQLTEAFFAAGNRTAGTYILAIVNNRTPQLTYQMRLAEEYYGLHDWENLGFMLDQMSSATSAFLPSEKEKKTEVEKTLKRLIVQLDGEQYGRSEETKAHLQNSIFLYLKLFPKDLTMREKLIDGWLAVEPDASRKAAQLAIWIAEEKAKGKEGKGGEEIRLRKIRLSLAQELKDQEMIIFEALALADLLKKLGKEEPSRHHRYLAARIYYEQKEYDKAVPLFEALSQQGSQVKMGERPDQWAIQSQNLILDILNTRKQYAQMLKKVNSWAKNPALRNDPKFKNELKAMEKVYRQAEFQWAVHQGDSLAALEIFEKNCYRGEFREKSCANAKVLAVKLGQQKSLVKLLVVLNDEKSLASEYELMGLFSEAARLIEKNQLAKGKNQKATIPDYLKVALLYELDQDVEKRNQVLKKTMAILRREKSMDPKWEGPLYETLVDAGFWGPGLFKLPWNETHKMKLVRELESEGKGNKDTRRILTSSKVSMGPAWTKYMLNRLTKLDEKQKKQGFYGNRSKKKFQRRLKLIGELAQEAKGILEGADAPTRVYIAHLLGESYRQLAHEIKATSIPSIIEDEAQIAQIKANLKEMSSPFTKESEGYQKLKEEQLQQVKLMEKEGGHAPQVILAHLKDSPAQFANLLKKERKKRTSVETLNLMEIQNQLQVLQSDPTNKTAVKMIHQYYVKRDQPRLANYFQGRLKNE